MQYLQLQKGKELEQQSIEIARAIQKVRELRELSVKTEGQIHFLSTKNLDCLKAAWVKELNEKDALIQAEFEAL